MISNHPSGFTLLELLIALSIFAIISLGGFKLISQIVDFQHRSERSMQDFQALGTMLKLMEKDLLQAIDRPVRDEFGEDLPALMGNAEEVELTHGVSNNRPYALKGVHPMRADLQRTLYSLQSKYQEGSYINLWVRRKWDVLDRLQNSEPIQTLAVPVTQISFRYLSHDRQWSRDWPMGETINTNEEQALPLAIEAILVTPQFGTVTRLFEVSQ